MNKTGMLLPVKVLILVGMVFTRTIEQVLVLAGVLALLIALPKVNSMRETLRYSGYMRSSSGEVYFVNEKHRSEARSQGFRELPMLYMLFSDVVAKEWTGGR